MKTREIYLFISKNEYRVQMINGRIKITKESTADVLDVAKSAKKAVAIVIFFFRNCLMLF